MAIAEESEPFLEGQTASRIQNGQTVQSSTSGTTSPASHTWPRSLTPRISSNSYRLVAIVFLTTSLCWGFVLLYIFHNQPTYYHMSGKYAEQNNLYGMPISGYKFLKCGTTVPEAIASGCGYDILTNHWTPRPCSDPEAVKEYQSDGSWHAFADENRTESVALEVMGDRPHYYTSLRDHIVHCAMLWRRQHRLFTNGRKNNIDSITMDPEHTMHCSQFLIDMTDRGEDFRLSPIRVDVGFAGCFLGS